MSTFLLLFLMTEPSHFVNFQVEKTESELILRYQFKEFHGTRADTPEDQLLLDEISKTLLDGHLQQVVPLAISVEALRGLIFPQKPAEEINEYAKVRNFPLLRFHFRLEVVSLNGDPIAKFPFQVYVFLSPEPGMIGIASKEWGEILTPIEELRAPAGASAWLETFLSPLAKFSFKRQEQQPFIVQLEYEAPQIHSLLLSLKAPGIVLSPYFLGSYDQKTQLQTLGSAYCEWSNGRLITHSSPHLVFRDQSNLKAHAILQKVGEPDPETLLTYLDMAPLDVLARKQLFQYWVRKGKKMQAWDLANRYSELLNDPKVDAFMANFETEREKRVFRLNEERDQFQRHPDRQVVFDNPIENQLLGGKDLLQFHFSANSSRLLSAEVYLNGQFKAAIQHQPYQIPLLYPDQPRYQKLNIRAFFEDETFSENAIDIRILPVDTQELVELRQIRAVVTDGKGQFNTKLDRASFQLKIANERRSLRDCYLDQKPLRLAILLDSSQSMQGDKKYRAQAATFALTSHLKDEDSASLYTFDQQVLRISDFSNKLDDLKPLLFSIHPMMETHLYDAIYLAHQAVLKQAGTKVILVVSDGNDSGSLIQENQLRKLFAHSPVMVYSIVIAEDKEKLFQGKKSQEFLKELAQLTGSSTFLVKDTHDLSAAFAKIYQELKSFYYIDYFGLSNDPDELNLNCLKPGFKLRWHRLRD